MGSCVSMHTAKESGFNKKPQTDDDHDKILIPSPLKNTVVEFSPPAHFITGSKDEAFFDSQPWLDSDCEDDYYSVNGDFTPSRGNTPVHHSFPVGKLQVNKTPAAPIEGASEPSPPDKKKRLSELFKDSLRIEQPVNEENAKVEGDGTPYLSGTNSGRSTGRTPNGEDKSFKSAQCCLPGLLSSHSFRERKKMMRSPGRSGG